MGGSLAVSSQKKSEGNKMRTSLMLSFEERIIPSAFLPVRLLKLMLNWGDKPWCSLVFQWGSLLKYVYSLRKSLMVTDLFSLTCLLFTEIHEMGQKYLGKKC